MNWYLKVIKSAFDFNSRARRKEYWMFFLFNMIISIALMLIENTTGLSNPEQGFGMISGLYSLAMVIPSLAVCVRRLHDTNKSGWYILISLIPLVGPILLLVRLVKDGDLGENKYGPNPKATPEAVNFAG